MPSLAGEPTHWVHGTAFVEPDVKIHYLDIHPTKANGQTLILIHGFPQTSYEWRHVVQPFADRGYRVVCPDYRGAGDSSRPAGGYDKMTMSRDIYLLARDHLKLQRPIVLGHDIGSMVAVCYALQFEDSISALICTEAPQPGTKQYDLVTRDDEYTYALFYHFFFHAQPDIPELLTQGKEREYISSFYDRFCYNGGFLTDADVDHFANDFARAGGMRAGFSTFRTCLDDRVAFRKHLGTHGKLKIPVLAMAGEHSKMSEWLESQTKEFAEDVTFAPITKAGHWLAEENPVEFVETVAGFLHRHILNK